MSYEDLLNIDEIGNKRVYFEEDRWEISYYCKDCTKLVEVTRLNPKWYDFSCTLCSGVNIALGTKQGLITNYKIK